MHTAHSPIVKKHIIYTKDTRIKSAKWYKISSYDFKQLSFKFLLFDLADKSLFSSDLQTHDIGIPPPHFSKKHFCRPKHHSKILNNLQIHYSSVRFFQ